MASLSGVIKRIISYTTAAIEKTDYFLLGNSSGEKKISWSTLINTIFQKQTKTIETSFLDIRLYRCGGVVYFRDSARGIPTSCSIVYQIFGKPRCGYRNTFNNRK